MKEQALRILEDDSPELQSAILMLRQKYTDAPFLFDAEADGLSRLQRILNYPEGCNRLMVRPDREEDKTMILRLCATDNSGEFSYDSAIENMSRHLTNSTMLWSAEFNGLIVGIGMIELRLMQRKIGNLRTLLVDKKCRNLGVGNKIMEARELALRSVGMEIVQLMVKKRTQQ